MVIKQRISPIFSLIISFLSPSIESTKQHIELFSALCLFAESYEISEQDLADIELNLNKFIKWFFETYYRREYPRLPACKYTVHGLSHLVRILKSWAQAYYIW
jgi:hypothetical protein